jgi:polysaccharide pyruvyl transferase CsaB
VRDRHSAQLLADWQVESIIAPDPVWALEATPINMYRDLSKPRVAVVLRSHPQLTSCRLATITEALQNLQRQIDAQILLIPFQPSQDKAIAQAICDALNEKVPHHSQVIVQKDPRRLKGIFQGVDLAIAMRLHGLIMAASEGCHCSAISYDPKVSYLMEDLGISGWELEHLPDDAQVLTDIWTKDLENYNQLLSDRIHHLKQQAFIHQKILN